MLYDYPDLYDTLLPVSPSQLDFYTGLASACGGKVLALACGTGQLLVPIAASDVSIVGVDISREMLGAARKRAWASASTSWT